MMRLTACWPTEAIVSKARNNTLAAVRDLNDYNTGRNEAAIKATARA